MHQKDQCIARNSLFESRGSFLRVPPYPGTPIGPLSSYIKIASSKTTVRGLPAPPLNFTQWAGLWGSGRRASWEPCFGPSESGQLSSSLNEHPRRIRSGIMSARRKLCRYGPTLCPRGDACMFHHDLDSSSTSPLFREASLPNRMDCVPPQSSKNQPSVAPKKSAPRCQFFSSGSCTYGDSCRYGHLHPHGSSSEEAQKPVCRYFLLGTCKYGHYCHFSHTTSAKIPNERSSKGLESGKVQVGAYLDDQLT